ncbi:hypothetical protein G6F24_015243 [Rhizopus arrhizus]|nr:hypothetical protein G6F24_015243 [Rhizopus arrhizus]
MPHALHHVVLRQRAPAIGVGVDRVRAPARYLAVMGAGRHILHRVIVLAVIGQIVGLQELAHGLLAVHRVDGEIGAAMEHQYRQRARRRRSGTLPGQPAVAVGRVDAACQQCIGAAGNRGRALDHAAGMDGTGGKHVRVAGQHDRGHRTAGGNAGDVDAVRINAVARLHLVHDAGQDRRFAAVARLVDRQLPVPATPRYRPHR